MKRTQNYLQFIVNMLWFRHPVSVLKKAYNLPAIHSWIWRTPLKGESDQL